MRGGGCGSTTSEKNQACQSKSMVDGRRTLMSKANHSSATIDTRQAHSVGSAGNTPTAAGHVDHFGGAGSAWRSSVYSRGPVNYPNNGWENGKTEFNQFSQTGTYIKNSDLPYAVAPMSTGAVNNNSPVQGTVSNFLSNYAAYGGGKKKKQTKKKKSVTKKKKSVKKKSVTKKKKK